MKHMKTDWNCSCTCTPTEMMVRIGMKLVESLPYTVTFLGLPPNAAIYCWTHLRAKRSTKFRYGNGLNQHQGTYDHAGRCLRVPCLSLLCHLETRMLQESRSDDDSCIQTLHTIQAIVGWHVNYWLSQRQRPIHQNVASINRGIANLEAS